MSHWNSPSTSRCCISAVSSSRAPAPRWSSIPAPGRSTLAHDALLLSDVDAYYGDSHVLHRVSLRLGQGRLLGLLGRNGAGKSTCMSVAIGWLAPRRGQVSVHGTAVGGRSPEAIAAQGVALVPQGRRVFRSLTVRENLVVAFRKPRDRGAVRWTFDRVCATF